MKSVVGTRCRISTKAVTDAVAVVERVTKKFLDLCGEEAKKNPRRPKRPRVDPVTIREVIQTDNSFHRLLQNVYVSVMPQAKKPIHKK